MPVNRNAPRSLVPNQKHDFGPRIGFAYNMFKNTVLRGGYGIFYSSYEAGPLSIPNPGNNPPFFEQANYNPISAVQRNPIVGNLSQGFPGECVDQSIAAIAVFRGSALHQSQMCSTGS